MPGDHLHIRKKQLIVNGKLLNEPYVVHTTGYVDAYRDNFPSEPIVPVYPGARDMLARDVVNGEVVVPPGHYFVMGDNRDSSLDSRYWGFIEQSDILGFPSFVYYSDERTPEQLTTPTMVSFPHVRWSRIFRLVS